MPTTDHRYNIEFSFVLYVLYEGLIGREHGNLRSVLNITRQDRKEAADIRKLANARDSKIIKMEMSRIPSP